MSSVLLVIFALALIAFEKVGWRGIVLWLHKIPSPDTISPIKPDFTMEEAWDRMTEGLEGKRNATGDALVNAFNMLKDSQRQALKANFLKIERAAAASENPMEAIRVAFMEYSESAFFADELAGLTDEDRAALATKFGQGFTTSEVWHAMALGQINIAMLRGYLKIKYDDCGNDDWSEYFRQFARHTVKERVKLMVNAAQYPTDSSWLMLLSLYPQLSKKLIDNVVHCPRKVALKYVSPDELPPISKTLLLVIKVPRCQ